MHSKCVEVTFAHTFDSATLVLADGTSSNLVASDLATYGVTLDSAGGTLTIDSNDSTLDLGVLTLTIRNGINTDADWYNLSIVEISYDLTENESE